MEKKRPGGPALAPMELREAVDRAVREHGVRVQDLAAEDMLTVRTVDHVYTFRVTDPERRTVIASGGVFAGPTEVHLLGASLSGTGTMVRLGWIAVGYRLVLGTNALLSETQSVDLNGVRLLPTSGDAH